MKTRMSKLLLCLAMVALAVSCVFVVGAFAADGDNGSGEARIGDVYYATIADAINAAENGDTVTVASDVEATVMPVADKISASSAFICIPAGKTVTLDLNGKTVSVIGDSEALYDTVGMEKSFFAFGTVFIALAFVTMLFVKHGDSIPAAKASVLENLDVDD